MSDYPRPDALASTDWLAERTSDPTLRIVDLRYHVRPNEDGTLIATSGRGPYEVGHIPGAVFVDPMADLSDPDNPLHVLSQDRFAALMSRLGIANDTTVVVYDDEGGAWAARLWWALRYYGHENVRVLNGGLTQWLHEGRPLETTIPKPEPATFTPQPQPRLRVTQEEVLDAIDKPNTTLVDSLPHPFYTGDAKIYPTHRGGHIPGAANVPAPSNLDPKTRRLLPPDDLRALWRGCNLPSEQRAITYCGGGVYASFNLFVLHLLGHEDAGLYDASWMEWGANADLPVETGDGRANSEGAH